MSYRTKIGLLFFLSFGLIGCSNALENEPTPPGKVGRIVGKLSQAENIAIPKAPLVSIMSHTSGIITVWATAPNNWLWGYSPFDSKGFGDLRNWYLLENANGTVSFRNASTNTCMATYKSSGVVHLPCNRDSLEQQFDLLPLTNRAIALKSASNGLCLRTPLFRSTVYMSLLFADCVKVGEMTQDQQWFITPPIKSSHPIPVGELQ